MGDTDFSQKLFQQGSGSSRLIVIMGPAGGLCGDLARSLVEFSRSLIKPGDKIVIIGKEIKKLMQEQSYVFQDFFPMEKDILAENITQITDFVLQQFRHNSLQKVLVIYPEFQSLARYPLQIFQFLPIDREIGRAHV